MELLRDDEIPATYIQTYTEFLTSGGIRTRCLPGAGIQTGKQVGVDERKALDFYFLHLMMYFFALLVA